MRTMFAVKNQTGETWPAYGMGRLGGILQRDGANADLPLYNLMKPDGRRGIYVVNGAGELASGREGTAVYCQHAQFVFCGGEGVEAHALIGAVSGQWYASEIGASQFRAVDDKSEDFQATPVVWAGHERLDVVYLQDLLAAADTFTDPSTAQARVCRVNAAGNLVRTAKVITVTNRFKHISLDEGTYGCVDPMDGEWRPIVADCQGDSVSGSGSG